MVTAYPVLNTETKRREREGEGPFLQSTTTTTEIKVKQNQNVPLIFAAVPEPEYSSAEARTFDFLDFLLTVPANDYLLGKFLNIFWS